VSLGSNGGLTRIELMSAIARTMHEFDSAVMEILGSNPRDVPFAALYHVETRMWSVSTVRCDAD
jgi:hypothetical protein